MITINNVSANSVSVTPSVSISSSESKSLQTQITGKQQSLNKLTSDAELTAADKEKEKRKIKQEIAELNRKLRQERLKEQEDNKELKQEQEKRKIIKEELLQEINDNSKKDSSPLADSQSTDKKDDNPVSENIPVVTLKNMISAGSAIELSQVEEQISRTMDGRQDVLAAEIQSDELYGTDTSSKQEELSAMRRQKPFTIESLHKEEHTSVPTMNLGSKIIIHE